MWPHNSIIIKATPTSPHLRGGPPPMCNWFLLHCQIDYRIWRSVASIMGSAHVIKLYTLASIEISFFHHPGQYLWRSLSEKQVIDLVWPNVLYGSPVHLVFFNLATPVITTLSMVASHNIVFFSSPMYLVFNVLQWSLLAALLSARLHLITLCSLVHQWHYVLVLWGTPVITIGSMHALSMVASHKIMFSSSPIYLVFFNVLQWSLLAACSLWLHLITLFSTYSVFFNVLQ